MEAGGRRIEEYDAYASLCQRRRSKMTDPGGAGTSFRGFKKCQVLEFLNITRKKICSRLFILVVLHWIVNTILPNILEHFSPLFVLASSEQLGHWCPVVEQVGLRCAPWSESEGGILPGWFWGWRSGKSPSFAGKSTIHGHFPFSYVSLPGCNMMWYDWWSMIAKIMVNLWKLPSSSYFLIVFPIWSSQKHRDTPSTTINPWEKK